VKKPNQPVKRTPPDRQLLFHCLSIDVVATLIPPLASLLPHSKIMNFPLSHSAEKSMTEHAEGALSGFYFGVGTLTVRAIKYQFSG
jgi:hypothetical protein